MIVEQVQNILAPAGKKVVKADNFMTVANQTIAQMRANETRSASHQDSHRRPLIADACTIASLQDISPRLHKAFYRIAQRSLSKNLPFGKGSLACALRELRCRLLGFSQNGEHVIRIGRDLSPADQ